MTFVTIIGIGKKYIRIKENNINVQKRKILVETYSGKIFLFFCPEEKRKIILLKLIDGEEGNRPEYIPE